MFEVLGMNNFGLQSILSPKKCLKKDIVQLFSTNTTIFFKLSLFFAHKTIEKLLSKDAHNFHYCQLAQNQSKSQLIFRQKAHCATYV